MWEQFGSTKARYRTPSSAASGEDRGSSRPPCSITVDGPGGRQGCQLACRLDRKAAGSGGDGVLAAFQIGPVSTDAIPKLSESYIRGDDLVLSYAQQETDPFGLSLQVTPIECTERMTIIQLTISLQTDLLDSYPSIELSAASMAGERPRSQTAAIVGPRPVATIDDQQTHVTVLLSSRDQAAAGDFSDDSALRVQLFGNFLEKGVIRKSRPWLVVWRGGPPEPSEIEAIYRRLGQSPLPLTT